MPKYTVSVIVKTMMHFDVQANDIKEAESLFWHRSQHSADRTDILETPNYMEISKEGDKPTVVFDI